MFVLEVGLSVITNNPIGISGWSRLDVGRGNFSVEVVIKSLEKTVSEIHIANWVDALWEMHASWELTVPGGPVVFDSFHVPLVYNDNNLLLWSWVNLLEEIFISLIDKYSLQLWEVNIEILNKPVDFILIETFLRILGSSRVLNSRSVFFSFHTIEHVSCVLKSLIYVFGEIKSGFMLQSLPTDFVEMWAEEVGFCSESFRFF